MDGKCGFRIVKVYQKTLPYKVSGGPAFTSY